MEELTLSPDTLECLQSVTGYGVHSPEQFTPQECLLAVEEILDSLPEDADELLLGSFRMLAEISDLAVWLLENSAKAF